jgi:hypothetical protein
MKPWQKAVFSIFCVIAVIYFLFLGIKVFVEKKVFSKMPPDVKKEYEVWQTKKLSFNPADLEAKPFQKQTIETAQTFSVIWREKKKEALELAQKYKTFQTQAPGGKVSIASSPPSDEITTSTQSQTNQGEYKTIEDFSGDLSQLDSLTSALETLVRMPDYEIDVLMLETDPMIMGPSENNDYHDYLFSLQTLSKILEIKISLLVREEKTAEAFSTAETIMLSAKTHKFSNLMHRLISISVLSNGSQSWHKAVAKCDDPDLLRKALKRQISLKPDPKLILQDIQLDVTDRIGIIRSARRKGINTDIQGMTGKEIMGESLRMEAELLEQVTLPKIKKETDKENIRKLIKDLKTSSALFGGKPRNARGYGAKALSRIVTPILFGIARPNFLEAVTREKVSLARFDLLILSTAWKIYTLEHGAEVEKPEDLVPDLLPEIPRDPFAQDGKPYASKPFLYSIGPDSADQEGDVLYDPTNGTISSGDIFFREE